MVTVLLIDFSPHYSSYTIDLTHFLTGLTVCCVSLEPMPEERLSRNGLGELFLPARQSQMVMVNRKFICSSSEQVAASRV